MMEHRIGLESARGCATGQSVRGYTGLRGDRVGKAPRFCTRRLCGGLLSQHLGLDFGRLCGALQHWLGDSFRGRRNVVMLEDIIGAGSFAVVFRATLVDGLGRRKPVAVKFAKNIQYAVDAIRNEMATLAMVPPHRNIFEHYDQALTVLDGGKLGDWLAPDEFIVMELGGATLDQLVHPVSQGDGFRGPLAYRQWLLIYRDIADGLHHLEKHGVTHFDVKPCNVLIDDQLCAKLLDFGCSRVGALLSTQPFRHGGTYAYLPRECQFPVRFPVGSPVSKVDVYSLGVMMWEGITGQKREPPFVSGGWYNLDNTYPEVMRELIYDCLQCAPEARPSCDDISRQLRDMMELDWVDTVPCRSTELLDVRALNRIPELVHG